MKKNAFYAQSGGVTSVINATAASVILESKKYKSKIGKVYAGKNGILGALKEELIDTSKESKSAINSLKSTPGGAFGSCRFKLKSFEENKKEYIRLVEVFKAHNIGKLLIFNIEELPILGKGKGNKIINIPKDKLAAGEEFMAHAQLLADDSSLKIEVGKRSVTLKPKDWSEYVLSRAKRGKKVGKLINIERLIEEPKSLEEQ